MKVISYMDSYQYFGLWDCTMGYFDKSGDYKALPTICKTVDAYNCFGTRDSLCIYVSDTENLSIDNLAYIEIERKFDKERTLEKETIKISYYSKNFERLIPAIMKRNSKCDYDVKITFLYIPISEEELFDEKSNFEQLKQCGWFDSINEMKDALLSA